MYELKQLSKAGVPRAIEKADRYRLLNEPADAVSICMDVLAADPDNQRALITLILAVSDQYGQEGFHVQQHNAHELLTRVTDPYDRAYYTGVVHERRAKSTRARGVHDSIAIESFQKALRSYEEAIAIRPAGNEDAILRFNTCARIVSHNRELQEVEQERGEAYGD